MSDMNYVDDDFVHKDVRALARARRPEKVVITWVPLTESEPDGLSPRTLKCIQAYRDELDEFLARNGVEKGAISHLSTEVYVDESHRLYVQAVARSTSGKYYSAFVWS